MGSGTPAVYGGLMSKAALADVWSVAGRNRVMVEGVSSLNTKGDVVMCDGMRAGAENDEVPVSLLCVAATSVEMEYGARCRSSM